MSLSSPSLSFDRASFSGGQPPPESCAFCHRALPADYFRVNSHLACSTCAGRAQTLVPPDSHTAFSRALLFGLGAAVLGCAAYALFEILTGIMLGWIAIGVGFAVGWAMKFGSRGLGGRRYQIAAALLTYAAVAIAFVPVTLHEARAVGNTPAHQSASASPGESSASTTPTPTSTTPTPTSASPGESSATHPGSGSFLLALLTLLGLGLVSPFLILASSVGQGLLNLFITFLGIRVAWRHMASPRASVEGPFTHPHPQLDSQPQPETPSAL